jgi:hypothetical protein
MTFNLVVIMILLVACFLLITACSYLLDRLVVTERDRDYWLNLSRRGGLDNATFERGWRKGFEDASKVIKNKV